MAAAAGSMDYDDLAWAASNDAFDAWKTDILFDMARLRKFETLIAEAYGGCPDEFLSPRMGGFNVWLRMLFPNGSSAVGRVLRVGMTASPEEKVQKEVAVMRFLQQYTRFPFLSS